MSGGILLFWDEFDSLVKTRDSGHTHSMDHDMTNVMLSEIVALRGKSLMLVAASNFIDRSLVDQAAIRESHFDYKIEVPPPDFEARKAIPGKSIYTALGRGSVDAETVATRLADLVCTCRGQVQAGLYIGQIDPAGGESGRHRSTPRTCCPYHPHVRPAR